MARTLWLASLVLVLRLCAGQGPSPTSEALWQELQFQPLVQLRPSEMWTWRPDRALVLARDVTIAGPGTIMLETSTVVISGSGPTSGSTSLVLQNLALIFGADALSSGAALPAAAGPIAAINASSLRLTLHDVTVVAPFAKLSSVSGYWTAADLLSSLVDAATRLPATSLAAGPRRLLAHSTGAVSVTDLLLLPTDGREAAAACFDVGMPVYDSSSMRAALGSPNVTSVFVYQPMLLSPTDFTYRSPVNISGSRTVLLYGCGGTAIDTNLNYTRHSITVGGGGSLTIRGLTFTNSPLMNQLLWPRHLSPLLSLVDGAVAGSVTLSGVTIATPAAESILDYVNSFGNASSSNSRPVFTAANSSFIIIQAWQLTGDAVWEPSPGISAASAAASVWDMRNVTVTTLPPTSCRASTGVPGIRVSTGAQLRQLMEDDLIPALELVNNITMVPSEWPPEASGPAGGQIFVNGTKEVYACHPQPNHRYTVDFGDIGQVIFVFGTLRWRGSMLMINPRASPRRSWMYLLIGALSVETDGVILFEGLEISSNVTSPFTNGDDPFWATQCGSMCGSFIPDKASYRNVSYYDAFIYDYKFGKSDWVLVSQGRNISGSGFWGYTDVALTWQPAVVYGVGGGGNDDGVPVAAIAVPVAVGGALLIAAILAIFWCLRRRQQAASAAGKAGAGVGSATSHMQSELTLVVADAGDSAGGRGVGTVGTDGMLIVPNSKESSTPPQGSSSTHNPQNNATGSTAFSQTMSMLSASAPTEARIEEMKRVMTAQSAVAGMNRNEQITLTELLGEGTFGKVYKGIWRGTTVAVKSMVLPINMSGKEKREKMAVMETAISSSLSHPNIVQTYTYAVLPVKGDQAIVSTKLSAGTSLTVESTSPLTLLSSPDQANVHSWEVRLVLEFCDRGSLRDVLNEALRVAQAVAASASASGASVASGPEAGEDGEGGQHPPQRQHYPDDLRRHLHAAAARAAVVEGGGGAGDRVAVPSLGNMPSATRERSDAAAAAGTMRDVGCPLGYAETLDNALDVARAMLHMHSENIVHGDLKARNILLKSGGTGDGRGYVSKVADFGLSLRIDPHETHVSNVYQGTITHMAPEVLLHGKISKSSDVYAFAILMWEAYTAGQAFKGTPRALLGHEVTKMNRRPQFPLDTPFEYQLLACRCWESDPSIRPNFEQIIADLSRMRAKLHGGPGLHSHVVGASASNSMLALTSASGAAGPSGMVGGVMTSGANPGLPQGPMTPAPQFPGGVTQPSMTLGASDTDGHGLGLQMMDSCGQQLFYVQGVDSTLGSLNGMDSSMQPVSSSFGVGLPHMMQAGRPVPVMPPILEATGTPDTSAPLPQLGGEVAAAAAAQQEAQR